jgi:hypothetical protein
VSISACLVHVSLFQGLCLYSVRRNLFLTELDHISALVRLVRSDRPDDVNNDDRQDDLDNLPVRSPPVYLSMGQ